jgi:hypothetical protein
MSASEGQQTKAFTGVMASSKSKTLTAKIAKRSVSFGKHLEGMSLGTSSKAKV